ncbi:MAG TPA: hypothetical protein VGR57_11870 [Ktedonobacterales bacterium]|nr:hypothetical protein [Ktedonobacterales bacterium]
MPDPTPPPSAAFLAPLALHPARARFVASVARYSTYIGGVGAIPALKSRGTDRRHACQGL